MGHVQNRLGTALRTYKKNMKGRKMEDGGRVEGRGRLSDMEIMFVAPELEFVAAPRKRSEVPD